MFYSVSMITPQSNFPMGVFASYEEALLEASYWYRKLKDSMCSFLDEDKDNHGELKDGFFVKNVRLQIDWM